MTIIVDYGVGNLFSLKASLNYLGEKCELTGDGEKILSASRVILPGVGAFGDAADKLRGAGLFPVLQQAAGSGVPMLGICLGMQLLFESSGEYGRHQGLSLIPGSVESLADDIPRGMKVPHMGWNSLRFLKKDDPLLAGVDEGAYVYFVHSYCAKNCADSLVASVDYGAEVAALVRSKNVWGAQFHPEKSGGAGLRILKNFCEVK